MSQALQNAVLSLATAGLVLAIVYFAQWLEVVQ
jgi:hypothetical protein